jgi:Na+-translocating ferredoxin:NAD+ oxidoreductase RnfA subunit
MKIFISLIGAAIGSGIMSLLPMYGGLGAVMKGVGAAVGFGGVMLLFGLFEERNERARIEYELEQDRIKYEPESKRPEVK